MRIITYNISDLSVFEPNLSLVPPATSSLNERNARRYELRCDRAATDSTVFPRHQLPLHHAGDHSWNGSSSSSSSRRYPPRIPITLYFQDEDDPKSLVSVELNMKPSPKVRYRGWELLQIRAVKIGVEKRFRAFRLHVISLHLKTEGLFQADVRGSAEDTWHDRGYHPRRPLTAHCRFYGVSAGRDNPGRLDYARYPRFGFDVRVYVWTCYLRHKLLIIAVAFSCQQSSTPISEQLLDGKPYSVRYVVILIVRRYPIFRHTPSSRRRRAARSVRPPSATEGQSLTLRKSIPRSPVRTI